MDDSRNTRDGCDGGWYQAGWNYVKDTRGGKNRGMNLEMAYQYDLNTANDDTCTISNKCNKMVPFTVNRVKKITPKNPNEMKKGFFHNGPVAVAVDVNDNWWDYKSGILPHDFCGKNVDHAVVVVGYGEE